MIGYLIIGFNLNAGINDLALLKIAKVPQKAIYIAQPKKEKNRLFIVNQSGAIHIIKNNKTIDIPFLDISDRVFGSLTPESEKGLLGLAFHPNYANNGYFYINYINKNNRTVISRFSTSDNINIADKNSEVIILEILQPFDNNNGGHLAFGPSDGFLYIGLGDGGSTGDPYNNSQDLNTLLGSILRIDIDRGNPYSIPKDNPFFSHNNKKEEIFCYGLRNPWRFSFDRNNNDIIIGDVGKSIWEEIHWSSWKEAKGGNYGWRIMEGNHCHNPEDFCDTTGLIMPIHEYPNNAAFIKKLIGMNNKEASGCSVTGGYVYRGEKIRQLQGVYVFGDYCTGRIWSLKFDGEKATSFKNLHQDLKKNSTEMPLVISSFGEDSSGELYVVDYLGAIYKFISK